MKRLLHVDFETYCDIDVREVGAQAYARHKSCQVLMMAWAWDDEEPQLWVPDGPWDYESFPEDVWTFLCNSGNLVAHNVEFEYNIFWHVLDLELRLSQLHDTAALALINAYPKSLAGAASAIGLELQKDKRGQYLIRKFCTPRKPTKTRPWPRNYPEEFPEDWQDFQAYCLQDVRVEQQIWHRFIK